MKLPVLKHKATLVEANIDFRKPTFNPFEGDPSKKTYHALSNLLTNFGIGDNTLIINLASDPSSDNFLGPGGLTLPTNMTATCNYFVGFNPRAFQTTGSSDGSDDALDSLLPNGDKHTKRGSVSQVYFIFYISCTKDPTLLLSQISYEWGRFGNFIRCKELQSLESTSIYCFYFLFAMGDKNTLMTEIADILRHAQERMYDKDYFLDHSLNPNWGTMPTPAFTLRLNVPKLPRANTHLLSKMPERLQIYRKQFHLEVPKEYITFFTHLIEYAKRARMFKDKFGPHVHPSEVVHYQSAHGELKRAEKMAKGSTNYNASLTCENVFGFNNLDNEVSIYQNGDFISSLTGRDCLLSLFKLDDGSPLIAEVHQAIGGGVTQLVFPNTPEAESLINGFVKHAGGFSLYYLRAAGVDDDFISDFLLEFVDPSLVHTADSCEWLPDSKTILTPEEQQEDQCTAKLEDNSWFVDVISRLEDKTKSSLKKSGKYASPSNLFDLDAQSVQTMHEKNDVMDAAEDDRSLSSKAQQIQRQRRLAEETGLDSRNTPTIRDDADTVYSLDSDPEEEQLEDNKERSQEESRSNTGASESRSGSTPISGLVRFEQNDGDKGSAGAPHAPGHVDDVDMMDAAASTAGHEASVQTGKGG
jgi:hypothetical protein